jgi:hypothetical protein
VSDQDRAAPRTEASTTAGLQAKVQLRWAWFEAHPNQPMPEGRAEVEALFLAIEREAAAPQIDVAGLRSRIVALDPHLRGLAAQGAEAMRHMVIGELDALPPPLAAGAGDHDPLEIERLRSKAWAAEADALIRENARLRDIVEGAAGDRDRREVRLREALRDLNQRCFPQHRSSCNAMGGPGRDVYRESLGYPCDCGLTALRKEIKALLADPAGAPVEPPE